MSYRVIPWPEAEAAAAAAVGFSLGRDALVSPDRLLGRLEEGRCTVTPRPCPELEGWSGDAASGLIRAFGALPDEPGRVMVVHDHAGPAGEPGALLFDGHDLAGDLERHDAEEWYALFDGDSDLVLIFLDRRRLWIYHHSAWAFTATATS